MESQVIAESFFHSWELSYSERLKTNTVDFRNTLLNHRNFDRIAVSIARFEWRMDALDQESRMVP